MTSLPLITLTSDFGLSDPFVGIMKGVILDLAPGTQLVDLTHLIPPQDVIAGALALEAAAPYFPTGCIHLAVVDPGVGSDRVAVAIQTNRTFFVGPDNGLFDLVLRDDPPNKVVRLPGLSEQAPGPGNTFHGRDVFARAAALLASGASLDSLGPHHEVLTQLNIPPVSFNAGEAILVALASDHFGNLITNARLADIEGITKDVSRFRFMIDDGPSLPMSRTFGDVPIGEPVVYTGSSGRIEIGIRNGSAREAYGSQPSIRVTSRDG